MKKLLPLFCLIMLSYGSRSQFLFNSMMSVIGTANEGGYEIGVTVFNNSPSTIHGLKAAWYLGERFRLGYTIHYANNIVNSLVAHQRYRLYLLETGGYLEYIHKTNSAWVLSFPVNVNAGSFYVPETYVPADQPNATGYMALEPRIQIGRPLLNWVSFRAAAGYRFISAGSLYGTNSPNLAGPSVYFSLVLGNFE